MNKILLLFFFKSTATDLSQHPCFMNKKTAVKNSSETTKPRSDTKSVSVTNRPQGREKCQHILQILIFFEDFHLCKLTYSPKWICNWKIHKILLWQTCTESQKIWAIDANVPRSWTKLALPYFSFYTVNRYPMFFTVLWFLLVISLFKMLPQV